MSMTTFEIAKSKKQPKKHNGITEDTPLSKLEMLFVREYIKLGEHDVALNEARRSLKLPPLDSKEAKQKGLLVLRRINVQAEIERTMKELRKKTIMSNKEILEFFTSVARGEVKDQFGLDASLADRTKAAQELAKRTIDVKQKRQERREIAREREKLREKDGAITIKLDWARNSEEETTNEETRSDN